MIKRDFYKTRNDGVNLYRTYSDENYRILQIETNTIYDEAIDVETANFTYEETDEKIEEVDVPVNDVGKTVTANRIVSVEVTSVHIP